MSRSGLAFLALFAACNTGCTLAHYVSKQHEFGGVVAIPSDTNTFPFYYRDRALALIRQHVGPNYEIVKEETVITGGNVGLNQTTPRGTPVAPEDPSELIQEKIASGDMMGAQVAEWHITYRRIGPPAAAPPPQPGATPLPPPRQLP